MQVSLVMFKSDGTRRDFPVTRGRLIIGRKNNCDLRIPLSSVSRQHCEVRVSDEEASVRDLGSSNGTFLNSSRVQEAVLSPGDELVVGPVVFTVVINGEPAEVKPVKTLVNGSDVRGAEAGDTMQHEQPEPIITTAEDDEDEPLHVEPEAHSPTVELDDPIAALERLAEAERSGGSSSGIEIDFSLDDDEDERK